MIQNSIALPTTAHFIDQKKAIFEKVKPIVEAAGSSGVNILCLQVGCMHMNIYQLISSFYQKTFDVCFYKIQNSIVGILDDAIWFLYTREEVV